MQLFLGVSAIVDRFAPDFGLEESEKRAEKASLGGLESHLNCILVGFWKRGLSNDSELALTGHEQLLALR